MSVKHEIISLLEKNRNKAISGQDLANYLNVTRAAIWKAVKALKDEGYNIEATPNKGYILLEGNDILSSQSIKYYLDKDIDVYAYKEVDSTNTLMKKMALEGADNYSVIVSEAQSAGRGRFGRSFFSPAQKGIYMSVLLKRQESIRDAATITIKTAVAINRVIKRLFGLETEIKWVNDLFFNGKKICGILTEAISDFESGMIEVIIIGVGINVSTDNFPKELVDKAASLGLKNANRNLLIAEILKELMKIINEDFKLVLDEYKKVSCVLNKEIEFTKKGRVFKAVAIDINENGNLIVMHNNNKLELSSGEISIIGGIYETK